MNAYHLVNVYNQVNNKYWQYTPNNSQAQRGLDVVKYFGEQTLIHDIDEAKIDDLVNHLKNEKHVANSTVNRYLSALSKILRYAYQRYSVYKLKRLPFIEWQKESKERMRFISDSEVNAMSEYLKNNNHHEELNFYLFLLDTGCRLSEALNLQVRDYKDKFIILEQTKNGTRRSVPLTKRARSIIELQLRTKDNPTDTLWSFNKWKAQRVFQKVRKAIGLEHDEQFTLHMLRHSCASRLVQNNVNLAVIQQWLGHKSYQMTLRYSHLQQDNLLSGVEVLDRMS